MHRRFLPVSLFVTKIGCASPENCLVLQYLAHTVSSFRILWTPNRALHRRDGTATGQRLGVKSWNNEGHSTVAAVTAQFSGGSEEIASSGLVPSYVNTTRRCCRWKSCPIKTSQHKFLITFDSTFSYTAPFSVISVKQWPRTDPFNEPTAIETLWDDG